jgi:YHS domain-containing protein
LINLINLLIIIKIRGLLNILIMVLLLNGVVYLVSGAQIATVSSGTPETAAVHDLVCGMIVDPKTAEFSSTYEGKTYYFCSQMCKDEFDKTPASFLMR